MYLMPWIYSFIENFSKVKEIFSVVKQETDIQPYIYSEKNLITLAARSSYKIYVYQYSNSDHTLNLLVTFKDQYQADFDYDIFYAKNENSQINLIIFSNFKNLQLFTIEDYSKNYGEYELSNYFQFQIEYDKNNVSIKNFKNQNQIQNKIVFFLTSKNKVNTQIYSKSILIKNNKIESYGQLRLKKKVTKLEFYKNKIQKSNQEVGELIGGSSINVEVQNNRINYQDIKINLQNLSIGKVQSKILFEKYQVFTYMTNYKLVDSIYIYIQKTQNMKCNYYLIDIILNSILFSYKSDCTVDFDFYYIQKRKLLFSKTSYSLYNIDTKQRILNFSTTDQIDYAKTLSFKLYKDEKLLFTDESGKFFAFDLINLQFQQFVLDSTVKLVKLQYLYPQTMQSDQNDYYLVSINDSAYLVINETYLQEFSLSSNTLNQNQKLTISQFLGLTYGGATFIYNNQLLLVTKSLILQIYNQSLTLVDSITLPTDTLSNSIYILQDQYIFFYGTNKLYRLDLSTKVFSNLQDYNQNNKEVLFVDTTKFIIIFEYTALQYQKMVLLKSFPLTNTLTINQLFLNLFKNSALIQYTNTQISYIPNIENKPVVQTSYSSDKSIFSSFISSTIQVAYYYDTTKKQIIKHSIVPKAVDIIYSFTDTYTQIYADYYSDIFIYTQSDGSLKVFDPNSTSQQINLIQKFSGISRVQFCFNLSLVIVQTTANEIFIYNYKKLTQSSISLDLTDVSSSIKSTRPLRFQVQCLNNLIYLESPFMKFYTLDGLLHSFQIGYSNTYQNAKTSNALVDLQNKIVVLPHSTFGQLIYKNENAIVTNFFSYTAGVTKLYYDIEDSLLVVLTGTAKSITTVDCNAGLQKQIYYTTSTFLSTSVDYFLSSSDTLIVVDITPSIYLHNYKTNTVFIKAIQFSGCQSITYFENNSFLILQTLDSIHIYSYPNLIYIESLIDYNNPSKVNIKSMYLIPEMNTLFVLRQDSQILTYDLIQTIIIPEKKTHEIIKQQYLPFEQELIVFYDLQDTTLSLFENTLFRDEILIDLTSLSVPNKCNLYKVDQQSFVYISGSFSIFVKINFSKKKLEIIEQDKLQYTHSDTLYDNQNKIIYFIHSSTKQVYKLKINEFDKGLVLIGNFKYEQQQIIISNQSIIFSYKNILTSLKTTSIDDPKERLFTQSISFIKKLSQNENSEIKDQIFDYNLENTYDASNNQSILVVNNLESKLYILNSEDLNIIAQKQINYSVLRIVVDIKRKIIFSISDIYLTFIYDYSLNQISTITNPCLLDTKIQFDDKIIYTICPNTVNFYNSFTLEKLSYSIKIGYFDILSIKSIDKPYSYILTQSSNISVIQFVGNNLNEIRTIFSKSQEGLYIYESQIQYDINHSSYLHIKGLSWFDIVEYLIPFEKNEMCLCSLKYVGKDKTSQLIGQIQSNNQSSQQQIKQVQLQLFNDQVLEKIIISQKSQNGIQLIIYSEDKSQNIISLKDGNQADDPSFNELTIRDVQLKLNNQVTINSNKNIKKILIQNVDIIEISNELIIQNIDTLVFKNINFLNISSEIQEGVNYVILIKNCAKIILENIEVKSLNIKRNIFFKFENVQEIYINNLQIHENNLYKFIQFNNQNKLNMQNIKIFNLNSQSESIIEGILVSEILIKQVQIYKIKNYLIHNFYGCKQIVLQDITISEVENIKYLEVQPYWDTIMYPTLSINIINLDIQESKNIGIIIQAQQFGIEKSNFSNIQLNSIDLIYSEQTNIVISECNFMSITIENDFSTIKLSNYNNVSIKDTIFQNSVGYILYFLNQSKKQQIQLSKINFANNSHPSSSVILMILSQNILVQDSLFQNNNSQKDGGCMRIDDSQSFKIQKTNFISNKSNGSGGAIYMNNILNTLLDSSEFQANESSSNSGGAIYIQNSYIQILSSSLINCKFLNNKATLGLGGAIGINRINLVLEQTIIEQNVAAIGGGIHYSQVIPKVIQNKKIEFFGNFVRDNKSLLFGDNIGSVLRKMKLIQKQRRLTFEVNETKDLNPDEIIVSNFKSGGYLYVNNIQLIDEENKSYMQTSVSNYNRDVQELITKTTISIDDQQESVYLSGDLTATYQNNSFSFNTSISFQPNQTVTLQLRSQKFQQILDSDGAIFIPEKQLLLSLKVTFRDCYLGEIQKIFLSSRVCEECPEGKYSINKEDQQCSQCPTFARNCSGSKIALKNDYWSEAQNLNVATLCSKAPENCQPEDSLSKVCYYSQQFLKIKKQD